jgi:ribosomal-protein-alanine N-acetyltransferase
MPQGQRGLKNAAVESVLLERSEHSHFYPDELGRLHGLVSGFVKRISTEQAEIFMNKDYRTARLALKTLDESASEAVLQYFVRNRTFLAPWETQRDAEFFTVQYMSKMLENEQIEMDAGRLVKLWIFKEDEPERVIGSLGFSNIVRGGFQSCFLGYRLDEAEQGRGYMTEAVKAGCAVMFGEFGLHRIEANIIPRNGASLRVAQNAGFQNEGLSRRYLKINGAWEDHIHMVLLNDRD